eukprot:Seg169.18 transcript_id=Seg169.18/GoldUCD/mRNA.D3Y31 product="hypothetical protein" protein_id=Seg169.18/GoldUCD/D3Y31
MKDVIDGRNAEFMKCWANGDIKGVSQLYTEDCKIMCAGCDTLVGRQAVVDLFSKEYADGAVKLTLAAGEVAPLDASTCAYEIGCYKFDDKDGKEVDNGK